MHSKSTVSNVLFIKHGYSAEPQDIMEEVKNLRLKVLPWNYTSQGKEELLALQKEFTECLPFSNLLVTLQGKTLNIS